jgi:hypothetical protein
MKENYIGELFNDLPDGYGVLTGANYKFEGQFYNYIYIGEFVNGKKHGSGILKLLTDYVPIEELTRLQELKRDARPTSIHEFIGVFKEDEFIGEGLLYTDYGMGIYFFDKGIKRIKLK